MLRAGESADVPGVESLESRRLMSAGDLDPGWNSVGRLVSNFTTGQESIQDAVAQSDGKVVVVGRFGMRRYQANGVLDTGFSGYRSALTDVAIQPDGKILALGPQINTSAKTYEIRTYRFNSNGSLDSSFDGDGVAVFSHGVGVTGIGWFPPYSLLDTGDEILVQKDGKIVVVGSMFNGTTDIDEDFVAVRYNSNGSMDTSFGSLGRRFLGFGGRDTATAAAIDYQGTSATNPNWGKITIVGYTATQMAVARLTSSGQTDSTFSGDGKATVGASGFSRSFANSVVLQPNGKLVVAGGVQSSNGNQNFALARLTNTGSIDTTFGMPANGWAITDFAANDYASDLVVSFGGKLVAGGTTTSNFALAAYTSDGVLDTTFSGDGKVTTDFGQGASDAIRALIRTPNNTILAVGESGGESASARYVDVGPTVYLSGIDVEATETAGDLATIAISRSSVLPVATRVYYTLGGTATAPSKLTGTDYTGVPTQLSTTISRYIDIPANANRAVITITPVDDAAVEGTESIILSLRTDNGYTIGSQPITISIRDNDTVSLRPTADAYVGDGGAAATNFGGSSELQVRAGTGRRVAYLKFDLSSVSVFNQASLRLYGRINGSSSTNIVAQVFLVTNDSWSESGITWNNRPAPETTVRASATISNSTARWYDWDLTTLIKSEKSAGRNTLTLAVVNLTSSIDAVIFNSDEASSNQPVLRFQ